MAQFFTRQQTLSNLVINSNLSIMRNGCIRLFDNTISNSVLLVAPSNINGNISITFPGRNGVAGEYLQMGESGMLQWISINSNSGELLYNANGIIAGLQNIAYNPLQNSIVYRGSTNIQLNNDRNTAAITMRTPPSLSGSYTLTLPAETGAPRNLLMTNGSGGLFWSNIIAATRSGEMLLNNNGNIASVAGITADGNNLNLAGNMRIRFGGDNNMCIFCPNVETMQLNTSENIHMNAQKVAHFITGNNSNGFVARCSGMNSNIIMETLGVMSNIDVISRAANVNILSSNILNVSSNIITYKCQVIEIGNHITSRTSGRPSQIILSAPYVLFKAIPSAERDMYYCQFENGLSGQLNTLMFDNSLRSGVELRISFADNLVGTSNRDRIILNRNGQNILLLFFDGNWRALNANSSSLI